jgi:virginiamycin A acetyltransferase
MERFPDPAALFPKPDAPSVMFIRNIPNLPSNVEIGEFTYYDDPGGPERFLANVRYHFEFVGDRLVIGRYCAIATGATFVMNGGNHRTAGISTFPFPIFDAWRGIWNGEFDFPSRGDTVVGSDVWIGHDALVMPGVQVGHGAIIGTRSVVTGDVPAYGVVAGNPARLIRRRFDDATIERLVALAWWDWPPERVTKAIPLISQGDVDALEAFAAQRAPQVP